MSAAAPARVARGFAAANRPGDTYLPGPRPERISFVDLDGDVPRVMVRADGSAEVIIGRWPCDAHGRVLRDELSRVEVLRWELRPAHVEVLAEHTSRWGHGDLVVRALGTQLLVEARPSQVWALAQQSERTNPTAARIVRHVRAEVARLAETS